jgi:hypothetical protein
VTFRDEDGNAVAAEKALHLGSDESAWTLYLLQREEVTRSTKVTVTVTALKNGPPITPTFAITNISALSEPVHFESTLEIPFEAAFRLFRKLLTSPVAPFTALAGLAIPWLRDARQRREDERRQFIEQEIERINGFSPQRRLEEYLRKKLSSEERTTLWIGIRFDGWEEIALQQVVEALDQEKIDEARRWLKLVEEESPDHDLVPPMKRLLEEAGERLSE